MSRESRRINRHPIVTVFLDKLGTLNGLHCPHQTTMGEFAIAYVAVEQMAKGQPVAPTPYHSPTH